MFDLIKQTMLMGVGLAAMTKDRIEKLARDVADQAKLSQDKGKQFVDEVMQRAEKAKQDMQTEVSRLVGENLQRCNLPSRDDISALNARIERLEQMLQNRCS
ncbi:MAG: phasin family protein [Planctomycetes bacterium]|nr:phasin family protein [Planctomycetota bacterium]